MNSEYVSILYQYLFKNSIWFIGALLIFLIMLIVEFRKKKREKYIKGNLVFIALILGVLLFNFITVQIDISQNSTVTVNYVSAYYHPEGDPQFLVKPYWFETNEDYTVELSIVTDVPKKLENGIVVYSKHSRVLLDYTGTAIENW